MLDTFIQTIIAPASLVLFVSILIGLFVGSVLLRRMGRRMPFYRAFLKFLEYVGNVSVNEKSRDRSL